MAAIALPPWFSCSSFLEVLPPTTLGFPRETGLLLSEVRASGTIMTMYGLKGFGDQDPAELLNSTIQQAKDRLGSAGLWGAALLAVVAFVAFSGPKRRR